MNDENNNDMNNVQNDSGILPGVTPDQVPDPSILPGMENDTIQNPNQHYEQEMGINMNQNMQQDPMNNNYMNGNPYQMNQDMNYNPYGGVDMQYGNPNMPQDMNGQIPPNNPYQGMDQGLNFNPYNEQMEGNPITPVQPNDPYANLGGMPQMGYDNNMNDPYIDPNMSIGEIMDKQDPSNLNPDAGLDGLEEQFKKAWMGSLYEKSLKKKFNWCAALFGPAYLMYRKIYLTGIITFLFQTIVLIASMILYAKMPAVGIAISLVAEIGLFIGLGLGFYSLYRNFIKGKLQVYSRQTSDTSQLLNIAAQKGGTSIVGVILELIASAGILPLATSLLISAGMINLGTSVGKINTNTIVTTNIIEEPEVPNENVFQFDDEYSLVYDMDEWYLDETAKTLTKGNYSLAYATKFTSQQCGFDLSSADGRAALLKYMIDSFNAQIAQSDIQIDTGNTNFIPQNGRYYNYMDFITATAIQRNYFVVIPEDNMLLQFTLGIDDTAIDDQTNIDIIDMLTSVERSEDTELNVMTNMIGTTNSVGTANSVTTSNSIGTNNVIDNEVSSALSGDSQNVTSTGASNLNESTVSTNQTSAVQTGIANTTQEDTSATLSQFIQ